MPASTKEIHEMHAEAIPHFRERLTTASRNERYKKGEHWTTEEAEILSSQNRQPYAIPLLSNKINTVLAMQRQNRTSFKVVATSDPDDELKAEAATILLSQKEKEAGLKYLESEVFDAGISINFGAAEICTEGGKVTIRTINHKNLIWDPFARDYLLNDARFMAKVKYLHRHQIESQYGKLPSSDYASLFGEYIHGRLPGVDGSQIMPIMTHYQRTSKEQYAILMHGVCTGVFHTKQDAEQEMAHRIQAGEIEHSSIRVIPTSREVIERYLLTGNEVLEYESIPFDTYPICVYRSFHFGTSHWTLADLLYHPQLFLDRIIMQIDHSFGRDVKNVFQGNIHTLAEGETPETAKMKAEQTGGIIWTRSNDEVFRPLRQSGVNPQYMQMAGIMQSYLEDLSGGRSFHGLHDAAGESGKAILAKQQQGQMVASLFLDNLNRWKRELGKRLFERIIHHESDTCTVKVLGDDLTDHVRNAMQEQMLYIPSRFHPGSGYVKIPNLKEYFRDASLELLVTEAPMNESLRAEKFDRLLELHKAFPGSVPLPLFLEYLDTDYTVREQITSHLMQHGGVPTAPPPTMMDQF